MMRLAVLATLFWCLTNSVTLTAGDSWRKKPADQWTDADAREVLTDSPWAKRVKVRYVEMGTRAGGGQTPTPGTFPPTGTPPIGTPGGQGPVGQGPTGVRTGAEVLIRWESASVIRSALRKLGVEHPPASELVEDNYLIAAVGIPELGTGFENADDATMEGRLRDAARLFIGNERSVLPARARAVIRDDGWTVVYVFPKTDIGPLKGDKIKLLARVGPAQFSAEFKTKDMQIDGKPDL